MDIINTATSNRMKSLVHRASPQIFHTPLRVHQVCQTPFKNIFFYGNLRENADTYTGHDTLFDCFHAVKFECVVILKFLHVKRSFHLILILDDKT